MKRIILFASIIGLMIGAFLKIAGYKTFGDIIMGIFLIGWIYSIITIILNFNRARFARK